MGAGNGRMWTSAPTRVTGTRRASGHTDPPLISSCRGRRPRRPAFTAKAAPAERECKGIRDLPGDFHHSPTRGQGDFQPPNVRRVPVGNCPGFVSTHLGQPPYLSQLARTRKFGASVLFFWTGRGPFSFRQDRKENGGRIASANADFPRPNGRIAAGNTASPPDPDVLLLRSDNPH